MKELTQVLRFVIPGGFFVIYFLLFSPLFGFEFKTKDSSAIIIFLIPAIGYFLSSIHHLFYNRWSCYRMKLKDVDDTDYPRSWAKYNIRWRKQSNKGWYKEINNRNNSLTDLVHSNGTNLISLGLAIVVLAIRAFISNYDWNWNWTKIIIYSIMLCILFIIHIFSYCVSKKNTQEYLEIAIAELEKAKK